MGRNCADCGDYCEPHEFSNNQWSKGPYYSRCQECVGGGRVCADCGDWCASDSYSNNQWRKGRGGSRCYDCVQHGQQQSVQPVQQPVQYQTGYYRQVVVQPQPVQQPAYYPQVLVQPQPVQQPAYYPRYECHECGRQFDHENKLRMHMQVHRPRTVACPVCGEVRFKSGANAVQHVESGYCRGCRGQEHARRQIHEFASQQQSMRRFMSHTPLLTNGSYGGGGVPDYPYQCPECAVSFRQLSQLLQHRDNKHNQLRMLGM